MFTGVSDLPGMRETTLHRIAATRLSSFWMDAGTANELTIRFVSSLFFRIIGRKATAAPGANSDLSKLSVEVQGVPGGFFIVPITMELVPVDFDSFELLIGNFDPGW